MKVVKGVRTRARGPRSHSVEVGQVYERVLAGTSVRSRHVEMDGRVHLLEKGAGPPVVLLHSPGGAAGFFLPLLNELDGVRAMAPDRPGQGLSDPIDLPRTRYRENAVAWLDRLLDTLELDATALLGHSGGAMWALWYALARPDRVFASPTALLSPSGFRRRVRVRPDELGRLSMPTLVVWGAQDPLGAPSVARAVTRLIPQGRLHVMPTGHGPWLGEPVLTARTVADFVQ